MENPKPSLGQISTLRDILEKDENLSTHFDFSGAFEKLENITLKQKNLFYALLFNKRYSKLNKLMIQFGFKPINN